MEHRMESSRHIHWNGEMKCNNTIQTTSKWWWRWCNDSDDNSCSNNNHILLDGIQLNRQCVGQLVGKLVWIVISWAFCSCSELGWSVSVCWAEAITQRWMGASDHNTTNRTSIGCLVPLRLWSIYCSWENAHVVIEPRWNSFRQHDDVTPNSPGVWINQNCRSANPSAHRLLGLLLLLIH